MQRRTRRIVLGVALIAALVAGGAAFTTAISGFPANNTQTAAFGQTHIVGATSAGVTYTLTCAITTTAGRTINRSALLSIEAGVFS